jgi:hypothetical protein
LQAQAGCAFLHANTLSSQQGRTKTGLRCTCRYGRRSWRPWWTSLALDLLSGHFSRRGRTLLQQRVAKGGGSKSAPTTPEKHAPTSLLSVALVRCACVCMRLKRGIEESRRHTYVWVPEEEGQGLRYLCLNLNTCTSTSLKSVTCCA